MLHPLQVRYEIVERNHEMRREWWGGYSRHNQLYRLMLSKEGTLLEEQLVAENHAMMMYQPLLCLLYTSKTAISISVMPMPISRS